MLEKQSYRAERDEAGDYLAFLAVRGTPAVLLDMTPTRGTGNGGSGKAAKGGRCTQARLAAHLAVLVLRLALTESPFRADGE